MNTIVALALLGFCSTTIDKQKVCTEVETINPKEHLLELCSPWAKHVGGKGWGYVNSGSAADLAEKQKSQCARVVKREPMNDYACQATMTCEGHIFPYDFGVSVKAYTQDEGIDACIDRLGDKYGTVLKETGHARCWMTPIAVD